MKYELLKSDIYYTGKIFDLRIDEIKYESGNIATRQIVVHNGASVIIPINDEGKIVMVTQFRYPIGEVLLEFPAGMLEVGEDPKVCAERELEEETGFVASKIIKIGQTFVAPAFSTEILYYYLATRLNQGTINREEAERGMQVEYYSIEELEEKIYTGKITDAKTIAGVSIVKLFLANNKI